MNISVGYPWWIRDHLRGSTALITCSCSGIKRRPVSPSVTLQQQLRLYVSASILKDFSTLPQAFGRFRRNQVCCWTTVGHGFGGPVLPTISAFRRLLHHLTEPSVFVHSTRISASAILRWIRDHLRGSTALITCSCSGIKRRPVSPSVTLQQQLRLYVSASILKVFQRFRRLLDDSEEIKCAVGRRLPRIRWSCATNHFSFFDACFTT
ncbi:hypothetical protein MRX96_007205 [Rhipicephalus microplus]